MLRDAKPMGSPPGTAIIVWFTDSEKATAISLVKSGHGVVEATSDGHGAFRITPFGVRTLRIDDAYRSTL